MEENIEIFYDQLMDEYNILTGNILFDLMNLSEQLVC